MTKAEGYIKKSTRRCQEGDRPYNEWVSIDCAKEAVKIAREEIYEWLANHYRDYMHNPTGEKLETFFGMDMITDIKQAMKDD